MIFYDARLSMYANRISKHEIRKRNTPVSTVHIFNVVLTLACLPRTDLLHFLKDKKITKVKKLKEKNAWYIGMVYCLF